MSTQGYRYLRGEAINALSPTVSAILHLHSVAANNYQVLPMLNWNCSALSPSYFLNGWA